MSPAEMDALVEQVGDEILERLGLPAEELPELAPASAWPRPEGGYAAALELVCASLSTVASEVAESCGQAARAGIPVVWTPVSLVAPAVAAVSATPLRVGALIDYPNGGASTAARLVDAEIALRLGAGMLQWTLGAGRARQLEPDVLRTEVSAAAALCADAGAALAVTLEASALSDQELETAATAALAGGADALCSSAGAAGHGFATTRAIAILRSVAGDRAVVVAGGRIAGFSHAAALVAAGADRIASADPWAILAEAAAG
ncbi:MAG: hypothetical protein R2724_01065 [Bryobacterales bacterium]